MAQRVEIQLIDDMDGDPADTTVSFAIDGVAYEIDLSVAHAQELRRALQPYLAAARRISSGTRRASSARRPDMPSPSAVRRWAKEEGITVSDRGRIPAKVTVRFREAADVYPLASGGGEWVAGEREWNDGERLCSLNIRLRHLI